MNLWLEKFILALIVAIVGGTALTNPWKLDWIQRVAIIMAMISLSIFVVRTIHKSTLSNLRPDSQKPIAIKDSATISLTENRKASPAIPASSPRKKSANKLLSTPLVQASIPLPDLVVDDFSVMNQYLFSRMKIKNFGSVGAEIQIEVGAELGGSPMKLSAELPDSIYLPAGATKTVEFGPLSPDDATAVTSGNKKYEVSIRTRYSAGGIEHGYSYKGRFDTGRGNFNLIHEKRW
jgi:hypothetical protein